jgi:hypothetical protein
LPSSRWAAAERMITWVSESFVIEVVPFCRGPGPPRAFYDPEPRSRGTRGGQAEGRRVRLHRAGDERFRSGRAAYQLDKDMTLNDNLVRRCRA